MKNFNFNNKKFVYSSCLMLALVGLTSFNPFNQSIHFAIYDNSLDESISLAATSLAQQPPQTPPLGQVANQAVAQNAPLGGQLGTVEAYSLENNQLTLGTGKSGDALAIVAKDKSILYITGINKVPGGFEVKYKIRNISDETKNLTKTAVTATSGGVCIGNGETCTAFDSLIDPENEHSFDLSGSNLSLEQLKQTNNARDILKYVQQDYNKIMQPYRNLKGKPTNNDQELHAENTCSEGMSPAEQSRCLKDLKKKICTYKQLRNDDQNCITKEEYSELLQDFVQNIASNPDISDSQFRQLAKVAGRDPQARQMVTIATQYRGFLKRTTQFGKGIDRTMNGISRIDDRINEINSYPMTPWTIQVQNDLIRQRQALVMTIEREAESFKQQYQNSSLGGYNGVNSQFGDFAQELKSDLDGAYAEMVGPISDSFFDPNLAYLDRHVYGGSNGSNFANLPLGQGPATSNINTGTNPQACQNSNDPRCQNGYMTYNRPVFGDTSNQYNYTDPNLVSQRYQNRPFNNGSGFQGQPQPMFQGNQFMPNNNNNFRNPPRFGHIIRFLRTTRLA